MRDGVPYGNFLLLKRIAIGGMAEVFLASAPSGSAMPSRVALKRILPLFSGDPDFLRAFLDEARVAALLSHKRFARTYEVGEVDGSLYIAMDHIDGNNLSVLSQALGAPFPWPLMARIAIDLCEALQNIHTLASLEGVPLGLVHRDVSPSNVMVDRAGEVKLIDFGIARSSAQWHRTLPGIVKANLAYAAPELFQEGVVDARADLYGVGLCLYEVLGGQRAFSASEADIVRSVLEDNPPPLSRLRPDLPPHLCDFIHSAIAKDPARRPSTAKETGAALEVCLAEAGLKASHADVARFLGSLAIEDRAEPDDGPRPHTLALQPTRTNRSPTALADRSLVEGDRIGRYRILGTLARGGMADVWLARDAELPEADKTTVVLKTINRDLLGEIEFVRMFLDEARVAAQINHPNVVQLLDLGEDRGCYFIAMEHLAGQTAHSLWRDLYPFPLPLAAHLIAECCAGLSFAHDLCDASGKKLNIVHRDVTPDNILVTWAGEVKLIDFGIAKAVVNSHLTDPGVLRGKVSYFAPEQASRASLDWRVDIWGLGVNLYQLSTGRMPFREDSIEALLRAIETQTLRLPSTVRADFPPALEQIILRALEKDPARRYPSAAAMRADLVGYLATEAPVSKTSIARLMEALFSPAIPWVDPSASTTHKAVALGEQGSSIEPPTTKMPVPI